MLKNETLLVLYSHCRDRLFNDDWKSEAVKEMIDNLDCIKKLTAWQKHCNRVKRLLINWKKVFVTHHRPKGWIFNTWRTLKNLRTKNQKANLKLGKRH